MNVAKLAAVFQLGGVDWEPAVVTMHAMAGESHDPITEAELEALAISVFRWWSEDGPYGRNDWFFGKSAAAWYPAEVKLQSIEAERVEPTLSDKIVVPGENWAGEAGDLEVPGAPPGELRVRPLPPQCAILVKLDTTEPGRRTTGRLYLPACQIEMNLGPFEMGWSTAKQAVGRLPEEHVNQMGEQARNLAYRIRNTTETEAEFVLAVYSRTYGEVHPVIGFGVHRWLRTQRPRAVSPGGHAPFSLLP